MPKPSYIFDIETTARDSQDLLSQFQPTFKPDSRLKDEAKIKADIEDKRADWLACAALHAEHGKILCIGFMEGVDRETFSILEGEETAILKTFWNGFINNTPKKFIGHFVKGFDVPFIIRRSFILGVEICPSVMEGRYMCKRIVDTMEAWACGTRDTISLDNLSRALGVGKKNGSGADFAKLYKEEPEKAKEYLINDLHLTALCAQKMGLL